MSTLTLTDPILNTVGNESDLVQLYASQIEHDPAVTVSTRQYVGGWFPVRTPGRQRSAKVTTTEGRTTDAHVAWLKAHQGVLVWYRDGRGEKFAGVYTDLSVVPSRGLPYWVASFTVSETVYSDLL